MKKGIGGEEKVKDLSQVSDLRVYIDNGTISQDKVDWRMKGDPEISFEYKEKPIILWTSNY